MQTMRIISKTAAQWGLQPAVPTLLHPPRTERAPKQGAGCGHACGHCATAGSADKRGRCSIRRPDAGETPLSPTEVVVLLAELGRVTA